MIKAVVDTNCLRASIPPKSPFYKLYQAFESGKFEWYVSNEILMEYDEIITETYSHKTAQFILHQLAVAPNVVFSEPAFKWNLILNDPDDKKFSDLAISSNCDYLVTNDRDFDVFRSIPFPKLAVIDLQSFLELLSKVD